MILTEPLRKVPIDLPPGFEEGAQQFLELLLAWNRRINLVSRRLTEEGLAAHVISSLAPLVAYDAADGLLLDVGSGGGFPAFVLLLARPRWQAQLVESVTKKCVFLEKAIEVVAPGRAKVLNRRYEDSDFGQRRFDLLTSRAVRIDARMGRSLARDIAPTGRIVCFAPQDPLERESLIQQVRSGGAAKAILQPVEWANVTLVVGSL